MYSKGNGFLLLILLLLLLLLLLLHRGAKSGCKLVTLFGGYFYDGLNAAIGVQHTEVPNLGAS